jgi:hypothetical protein
MVRRRRLIITGYKETSQAAMVQVPSQIIGDNLNNV